MLPSTELKDLTSGPMCNRLLLFALRALSLASTADGDDGGGHHAFHGDAATRCRKLWLSGSKAAAVWVARGADKVPYLSGEHAVAPGQALLVHVGKTCGSSVNRVVKGSGVMLPQVHVHPVTPRVLANRTHVIVATRDPVTRVISAFNHNHPDGGERPINSNNFYSRLLPLYRCYPTVAALALGLSRNDSCGDIARRALTSLPADHDAPYYGHGHLMMGFCFYIGGVLGALRAIGRRSGGRGGVFLIDTESCAEDTAEGLVWLGAPAATAKAATSAMPHVFGAKLDLKHHGETVTPQGESILRAFLDFEYQALKELRDMSVNKETAHDWGSSP